MGNIPFAFTIVVLALLFSFAEQGSDGEEIFLYFFVCTTFDVSHFVSGTRCHFGADVISAVMQHT